MRLKCSKRKSIRRSIRRSKKSIRRYIRRSKRSIRRNRSIRRSNRKYLGGTQSVSLSLVPGDPTASSSTHLLHLAR